ncbi:DUF6219 family protein, partial [Fusicatenibacter faecihominis]
WLIHLRYGTKNPLKNKEKRLDYIGRYQIMKSHKYWSLGALFCMLGCIYSGIKKSITAHKYFAYSSLLCMGMSIYSGHKLVSPKKKKITESNNSENS